MSRKQPIAQYVAAGLLLLCVFANPLEKVATFFKWIDELLCLAACLGAAALWLPKQDLRRQIPKQLLYFIPFFLYMFMQLLGTLIFRFQPWGAVIIDALTHAKFWLSLYACYLLGRLLPGEDIEKGLLKAAKVATVVLFILFLLEQFWVLFPEGLVNDDNKNIQCAQMMYHHPSYVAAAMGLLLAVLLSNWNVKSLPYILADLVILTFTFRVKAYGAVVAFLAILLIVVLWKQKVRIWHIALTGAVALVVAWERIMLYFVKYNGSHSTSGMSARSVLLSTGLKIMQDYFPLGTGFATFGSHQSVVQYSPVYYLYGIDTHAAMGAATRKFIDDAFWPIVFAQSGAIGLVAFLVMLLLLCITAWKLYDANRKHYAAALFCIAYMLINSIAEPIFNNQTALPLALLLGFWFGQMDRAKKGLQHEKT